METGCCDSRSGDTGSGGFAAAESPVSGSANGSADRGHKGCEERSPSSGSTNANSGKNGRNGGAKRGHTLLNSVNKSASQIRKPPRRRSGSPINWFPRKKTDSFLKRKIKLLQNVFPLSQEREGMNSSLDETLGNANPHYTRIAREKFAARAAAKKAMEARKAAMIEASWCRILHAARIQNKEAEDKLEKAEKYVAEAFEAAAAMGVMMYDRPDCPRRSCEIETSSVRGGASTHKVTASFETAFEVYKEVSAAVKNAFIRLASCPSSSNKEEFRDLLRKISQNPDIDGVDQGGADVSSQCELVTGSETEPQLPTADFTSNDPINNHESAVKQINNSRLLALDSHESFQSSQDLVNTMFGRLKCLSEDEIASLAVIVATCGLNAALLEMENRKNDNPITDGTLGLVTLPSSSKSSTGVGARRLSSVSSFIHGHIKRKEPVAELPSLDKFLVKHVTRLEKEVQEAKNSKKAGEVSEGVKQASNKQISENGWTNSESASKFSNSIPDLGSILVKHVSRLERDIHAAKKSMKSYVPIENGEDTCPTSVQSSESGQFSHHCMETEEANMERQHGKKSRQQKCLQCGPTRDLQKNGAKLDETEPISSLKSKDDDKENADLNRLPSMAGEKVSERTTAGFQKIKNQLAQTGKYRISRTEKAKLETLKAFSNGNQPGEGEIQEQIGLDKVLVKPVHRLERERMKALERADHVTNSSQRCSGNEIEAAQSLDKVLVKHVSRLEREKMTAKMAALTNEEVHQVARTADQQLDACVESLDQILVKHQSKLEKAKLAAAQDQILSVMVKGKKKDQQLETYTKSLDQVLVKHQSNLEKEKLAFAQDQILSVTVKGKKKDQQLEMCTESLDQVLVKHQTKLEKAKLAAAQDQILSQTVKGKKDQQVEACTESLDQVLVKHQSKLEKAKLAAALDPILSPAVKGIKKDQQLDMCAESLDQVLVKHQSRLEKAKLQAAQESADHVKSAHTWREARERELQEAWGGLSLGNTVKPHLSRLEREKAAWKKAEEEELRRAREV